jgi:hypothetical protein
MSEFAEADAAAIEDDEENAVPQIEAAADEEVEEDFDEDEEEDKE